MHVRIRSFPPYVYWFLLLQTHANPMMVMASASAMDTLPLDVWHHIFSFACADGGRTGARLARISHALRASSAAYRFFSVELYSIGQLQKFISSYEAALAVTSTSLPPADPPRVRHLTCPTLCLIVRIAANGLRCASSTIGDVTESAP